MPELSEEQAMNQFFSMSAGPWEYPKGSRRCNQMHHRMFHHLALPVLYQWIVISGHAKTSHPSISSLDLFLEAYFSGNDGTVISHHGV
jgi:hypothetical protein